MGCGASSKAKYEAASDTKTQLTLPADPTPVSEEDQFCKTPQWKAARTDEDPLRDGKDEASRENIALLEEIALKVENLRQKAQTYHEDLQKKVFEIEKDNGNQFGSQGRENGVALTRFDKASELLAQVNANGALDNHEFLQVEPGDSLEISVRAAGGWAYCKKHNDGSVTDGWVPADQVAEIVKVIADQESGSEMLAVKAGDFVEVVSRHYSGWVYCREWKLEGSSKVPRPSIVRVEGWVTDAFLEDNRSEAANGTKWHRLVLEALQRVVSCAGDLEVVLKEATKTTFDNADIMNWMGQCLEFTTWLDTEMRQITQAVSQHDISASSHGCFATIQFDTSPNNENELEVKVGARVVIENAENPGWIWCSDASDRKRQGWVPRNVLEVDGSGDRAEEPKRVMFEDLPSWVKEGMPCKWNSKSNNRLYDVKIRNVDKEKRYVEIVFSIDESCWKCVPFDHFGESEEHWRLTPLDDKAKSLLDALPSWVIVGRQCSWWSESRNQCMGVKINEICLNRRMVFVFFDVDQKSQKCVPFHQLIDEPETSLLQADKKGHAWRKKKKRKGGSVLDEPIALSDEPAKAESAEELDGDEIQGGQDFHQTQGLKMTALMSEMLEDIGDMVAPEGGLDSEGVSFADRLKNAYASEPPQENDDVVGTRLSVGLTSSTPMGFGATTFDELGIPEDTSPDEKVAGFLAQDTNRKRPSQLQVGAGGMPARPTSALRRNVSRPTSAVGRRQTKTTPQGLALAERIAALAAEAPAEPPSTERLSIAMQPTMIGGTAVSDTMHVQNEESSINAIEQSPEKVLEADIDALSGLDPTTPNNQGRGALSQVGESSREALHPDDSHKSIKSTISGVLRDAEQLLEANDEKQDPVTMQLFPPSPMDMPTGTANAEQSLWAPETSSAAENGMGGMSKGLIESTSASPEASPLAPPLQNSGLPPPPAEPPPKDGLTSSPEMEHLSVNDVTGTSVEQRMSSKRTNSKRTSSKQAGNTRNGITMDVSSSGLRGLPPVAGHHKQSEMTAAVRAMHEAEEATLSPLEGRDELRGFESSAFLENTVTSESAELILETCISGTTKTQQKVSAKPEVPQAQSLRQTAMVEQEEEQLDETIMLDDSLLGGDMDDPNDKEAGRRRQQEDTPLQLALRLLAPDSWDSDSEHTKWKGPEPETLLDIWPAIEDSFESKADEDMTKITEQLEKEERIRVGRVDQKQGELRERFDARAALAQSQFQPEVAEKFRVKAWEVMDAADEARKLKSLAKKAKVTSIRRKMKCRKEVIHRAMGPKHNEILSACFVPDSESLRDLTPCDAVREVSDTTWSVLRLVQVVALRPMHSDHRHAAWGGQTEQGMIQRRSARQDAKILHASCETVVSSLSSCLEALSSKLTKEAAKTRLPEKEIESVAKGESGLSKEQRRDRAMFEGQQEFSIERKIAARVEHQIKKGKEATQDVLTKVDHILKRRWHRKYKRRRVETLNSLAKLSSAVAQAEVTLDDTWQEQQAKSDDAAAELEIERRRVHAQTRLLLIAQMIIREEKGRMNEAYHASTPAEKKKKMLKSLRRIRRVHHDMHDMQVIPELKQNHSVLLYSLRMLEARLNSECPSNNESIEEEGDLEGFLKSGAELAQIDGAFEDHLTEELTKLHGDFDRRAGRRVAEAAQILVRDIDKEHSDALMQAREAIDETLQARTLADFANATLPMFTQLALELLPEAARHFEVENSPGDASTFRANHKRFQKAVQSTVKRLSALTHQLKEHPPSISVLWHDGEWEGALKATEEQWEGFRDAHPPEEVLPDTPREQEAEVESPTSRVDPAAVDSFAAEELRKALMVDDLELPAPIEHGEVGLNGKAKPPRIQASKKGGPPNATATTPKAKAKAKATGAEAKREEMRAMLGKLDALGQDMDRAMGKTSKIAKQASGAALEAPPKGGPKKGW